MRTEISFKEPAIRRLVSAAFPDARTRRTVKVSTAKTYSVHEYWDGGSKDTHRFVNLRTGAVLSAESIPKTNRQVAGNPYNLPIAEVELSGGFAIVISSVFCGKPGSYRIVLAEEDAGLIPGLPEAQERLLPSGENETRRQ